jgi:hypothetical protein
MKAFQIATAMRVRCDCDARANPRNEHCIIYESVSNNCDCAAMKIAALAHRSRNLKRFHRLYSVHSHRSVIAGSHTHRSARASQSQLEIKLYTLQKIARIRRCVRVHPHITSSNEGEGGHAADDV